MKEDIKKMTNDFVVRALIYSFLAPIIMTMIRGAAIKMRLSINIPFLISPIFMILLFLLPAMKDLKVSPLETNKKIQEGMSLVDMVALVFVSWSLNYFLATASNFITEMGIIGTVLQSISNTSTDSMSKYSSVLVIIIGIINVVTIDLIFRGVLLNTLRKYGDVFAIIVSATMYALIVGNTFFIPFNFIISILAGTVYVLSNDIKAPIMLSLLTYFVSDYLHESMSNLLGNGMYFYGIVLIIGSIFLASRKDFRNYISLFKDQYIEERDTNKGKYAVVFKTEAFMALVTLAILSIFFMFASAFLK